MRLLLDANVLYPSTLRDLFLTLSKQGKFELFWSDRIIQEWLNNIRPTLPHHQKPLLNKIVDEIKKNFATSWVYDHEGILGNAQLQDKDDVHVIEAAIKAQVNYIITFNTRDFPNSLLKKHNIRAVHPDRFISDRMLADKDEVIQALEFMCTTERYEKHNPTQIIELLKNRGLLRTARMLVGK
jgi:predicted nucleic acid-binding protein